ncbi:TIGR03619 family F420-dependent LLM class oxidoreductase [Actinoplanes friuliensis]|uniref:F420-dependent dehydrogenase n=1 Tax=Actinoplanes friuliensis DSM 7358 TaxID=1246995 RepID=U5VYP7_9ACTN|nr:TIGR03619 family F420-dependent LLM class oxidoreductase [Actinoplanes friuliensis]AGZ42068.1 F420-dependent dehydrogenase [Actinoplanes friuliensis DSM 7358]
MIRLGVNVPNFGPGADYDALLGWARFAEDNGFDTLVVSDHVVLTPEVADIYPEPFHDPFVLLAWLAGQTSTVKLGTSVVLLPYRHPLHTARMSAMLHLMSGGRFVLGVGAGWAASEFAALGADHARRGPVTDEYLEIITEAWAKERVSGPAYENVRTGPRPQGGSVPVWVGGPSRRAIRRAVRSGTAWHPINPDLGWLRDTGLPALRREAAEQGRAVPELVVRMKARLQAEPADDSRPAGVGTLDQVAGDVRALAELGAAEVILDPNPDSPRPRDFGVEQRQLREIKTALGG